MTILAMVFGMMPLALALHEGSDQSAPFGGLISSTLLTLVVVAVMLIYIDAFHGGLVAPAHAPEHDNQPQHALAGV